MVVVIAALSFVAIMSMGMGTLGFQRMLRWMKISIQYQRELLDTKRMLAAKIIELDIERSKKITYSPIERNVSALDEKTKALIRLAVSNPEKREAENAAMIVCKRLKEKIDD